MAPGGSFGSLFGMQQSQGFGGGPGDGALPLLGSGSGSGGLDALLGNDEAVAALLGGGAAGDGLLMAGQLHGGRPGSAGEWRRT
jgi:hypothetical protein